jgi:hypothetical protein
MLKVTGMEVKVERFYDSESELEVEVHRYSDGGLRSIKVSSENYWFWIDENGDHTCMYKDRRFGDLILELIGGYGGASRGQLE